MATPKYDLLQEKVIQWANRDKEIFGVTANNPNGWKQYVGDFLSYAQDEACRLLRVPAFEIERVYTIEQGDIVGNPNISVLGTNNWAGTGGVSYCRIPVPADFNEMKSMRWLGTGTTLPSFSNPNSGYGFNPGIVFNERTDERTFFDVYAETYGNFYWMRKDNYIYIKPALKAGAQIAISYYRYMPAVDSDYDVVAVNYLFNSADANGLTPDRVQLPSTNPTVSPNPPKFIIENGKYFAITQPFLLELTATEIASRSVLLLPPVALLSVIDKLVETYPNRLFLALTTPNTFHPGDQIYIGPDPSNLPNNEYIGYVKVVSTGTDTYNGTAYNYVEVDTVFSPDNYPTQNATATLGEPLYFISMTADGTVGTITYPASTRFAAYEDPDSANTALAAYKTAFPTIANQLAVGVTYFTGNEVDNWLKDQNERVLLWGALMNAGSFLDDERIEMRYQKKFLADIASLNNEEKMRRAKGGNVQIHFNGGSLI